MIAHIQYRRGLPVTEGCFSALLALEDRGWEIRSFEHHQDIDVDPEQPVIGGIPHVVGALTRLGIEIPDLDYPEPLKPFVLDPDVEIRTMGWARQARDRWPLFVKPTTGRKEFGGLTLRSTDDLLLLTGVDDELPVFVAESLDLDGRVEWRCFVIDGQVRDIRPYSRCPNIEAPSTTYVQMLANQWSNIPAGCSIDVVNTGTTGQPDWRIVECNDGYSVASYGMFRGTYAELLVKRWSELTGARDLWTS